MQSRCHKWIRTVVLCIALLVPAASVWAQKHRVPCAELVGEFDRVVSRPGIGEIDPIKVGKKVGVDPKWVERCASVFGRRVSRPPRRAGLAKEDQDIAWESEEQEEFAQEEFETRNDRYVQTLEGDVQKRRHLQRFGGDSSAEWNPIFTNQWRPTTSMEWKPYMLNEKFKLDSPPRSQRRNERRGATNLR